MNKPEHDRSQIYAFKELLIYLSFPGIVQQTHRRDTCGDLDNIVMIIVVVVKQTIAIG